MKKICSMVCALLVVLFMFGVAVYADSNEKEYYPGTFLISYDSVTGSEMIDTYRTGIKTYYIHTYTNMNDFSKYLHELEFSEGWTKLSDNGYLIDRAVFGKGVVFTKDGMVIQLNVDDFYNKVNIFIFEDQAGIYEPVDNNVINVYVNGKKVGFDVEPQLINGRTMVPMRAIFEALECDVEWDNDNQQITAAKEEDDVVTTIVMQIDKNSMMVDEEEKVLDVAPTLVDGRTLVPVRAISEALGVNVEWHNPIQAVDIYDEKANTTVLYNENDDTVNAPSYLVKKYQHEGYSTDLNSFYVTMYAIDGRTESVKKSKVEAQKAVGWYTEPVQMLYAPGKSQVFKKSEVAAQLAVGWYEEPVVYVYFGDSTMVAKERDLEKLAKFGWSTEKKDIGYVPHLSDFISTSTVTAKLYGTSVFFHNRSKYPLRIERITIDEQPHMYGSQKDYEFIIYPGESKDLHFTCYDRDCKELVHNSASQARLTVEIVNNNGFDYGGFLYFDINGIFEIY